MATINLGNLTFTHKGDYAGGTAYVKNDIVYYATNGNSYIAKGATTGNAPTSTAHWDLFLAGSSGIWNAGLSLGSAGQAVKVNSSGNALEFGTIESEVVKTGSGSFTNVGQLDLDGTSSWGAANTYSHHKLYLRVNPQDNGIQMYTRILQSGSVYTSGHYNYATNYIGSHNNSSDDSTVVAAEGAGEFRWTRDGQDNNGYNWWEFTILNMNFLSSLDATTTLLKIHGWCAVNNQDGTNRMHGTQCFGHMQRGSQPTGMTGLRFYMQSGNMSGNYYIYGFKK